MPLAGLGLILTVCGAACVLGFLGGLAQHCYMAARSRQAARIEAAREYPDNPPDIELGSMGGHNRRIVIDGEVCAFRGGPQM